MSYHSIDADIKKSPGGGVDIWVKKINLMLNAIDKYKNNEYFIMADIDIQCFDGFFEEIERSIKDKDMVFQQENDFQGVNIGIIACRPNSKVKAFWELIKKRVIDVGRWDQAIVNDVLFGFSVGRFKDHGLAVGVLDRKLWNWSSGRIDLDVVCHHANCVSDIASKWTQMDLVQKIMGISREMPDIFDERTFLGVWDLLILGNKESFKVEFGVSGSVKRHRHPNEKYWEYSQQRKALYFLDLRKRVSAAFTHYYYDPHFNRHLLAGEFLHFGTMEFYKSPQKIALYK
ncbi:hypothetical protein BC443_15935 [Salinicola sp. MIT1003]|nr:hypothetical protein BC443_15935 [Salinicola sp. MIT1003]